MTVDIQKMKTRLKTRLAELRAQIKNDDLTERDENEKSPEFEEAATDMVDEEMGQAFVSDETGVMTEIQDALKRIEEGTYGFCLQCGQPIPEKRLEAIPWAAYCIKDEEQREQAQGLNQ
jgi:DnaK suppressor protein